SSRFVEQLVREVWLAGVCTPPTPPGRCPAHPPWEIFNAPMYLARSVRKEQSSSSRSRRHNREAVPATEEGTPAKQSHGDPRSDRFFFGSPRTASRANTCSTPLRA